MLALELFESDFKTNDLTLIDALRDFLPLAVKTLKLPHIPKISLEKSIEKSNVPTFGRFTNDDDHVYVHVANRNPNDILRTLAHELVHYKQRTEHELGSGSWHTGSPAENQANELAGVIMRNFNSKYPQYLRMKPVILPGGDGIKELDETWSKKYKKSINCNNPKGFSQKAHCAGRKARKAGRKTKSSSVSETEESDPTKPIPFPKGTTLVNVSDVYDWYKLGMAVPNLGNADPKTFNKGVPHTVFAFGSEEEEHRMVPLLKRLGFTLHDIDTQDDYQKAIRASDVLEHLEQYVAENLTEAEQGCPPATQDISLNLKNRQKAIDEYHYGPLNPNLPNDEYWQELADKWNTKDIESVKQNRCGNCGAFDVSKEMQSCIAKGIGSEPGSSAMDSVDAGHLGYCKFLKFKCASKRTCDAWIEGGPITEGKRCDSKGAVPELKAALDNRKKELNKLSDKQVYSKIDKIMTRIANTYDLTGQELHDMWTERYGEIPDTYILENFADGKKPGRKGLAKRSGVNCKQSVSKLRNIAKHSSGEKQRMAHWCANMKAGKK